MNNNDHFYDIASVLYYSTTFSDWFKRKISRYFFNQSEVKIKTNRDLHVFPPFASALCHCFVILLVHWVRCLCPSVIGQITRGGRRAPRLFLLLFSWIHSFLWCHHMKTTFRVCLVVVGSR